MPSHSAGRLAIGFAVTATQSFLEAQAMGRSGVVLLVALLALAAAVSQSDAACPQFAAPFLSFNTGNAPYSLAIGDLNGDSRPDLAVANGFPSGTVSVLLGNGDGSFGVKTDFG